MMRQHQGEAARGGGELTRVAVTASVTLRRLRGAIHRHWRRILGGAFVGWLASSVVGAVALAYFADEITYATSNLLGAAIVWSGVAAGGVVGYATRAPDVTGQELALPETLNERR
jgi:hypothetical protein